MASDRAGNTLSQAKNLGALGNSPTTFKDGVSFSDKNDLLRLTARTASRLNVSVSGLPKGAKLALELFTLKGNKTQVLKRIGNVEFGALGRKTIDQNTRSIARTDVVPSGKTFATRLNAGEVYGRIKWLKGKADYRITFRAQPLQPAGGGTPTSTVLFNGSGLPQNQKWLAFGQVPYPFFISNPPFLSNQVKLASQTASANGVQFDSQIYSSPFPSGKDARSGYAGYSNYTADLATRKLTLVNSTFPKLDRTKGFTVSFKLAVQQEESSANRAGFSLVALSSDGTGIELGFKSNQIFAQSSTFTAAEAVAPSFQLGTATEYKLTVKGNTYQLTANGASILTGALRRYQFNPATSSPPLPVNPYATPNLLFFGDNTDQGKAIVTLGKISVT